MDASFTSGGTSDDWRLRAPEYEGAQALVRRLTHQLGLALRGNAPPPAPSLGSEEDLPLPPWMVEMPFLSPLLVAYEQRLAQLEAARADAERHAAETSRSAGELARENDELRPRLQEALVAAVRAAERRHASDEDGASAGGAEGGQAAALREAEERLALLASENAILRQRAETDARMLQSAVHEAEGLHAERKRAADEAARAARGEQAARTKLALALPRAEAAEAELAARTAQLDDLHAELLSARAEGASLLSERRAHERRVGDAQRALVVAQEAAAKREEAARAYAVEANTAAEAMAVQLDDAQREAASAAQAAESCRAELSSAHARLEQLAHQLDEAQHELGARTAREERGVRAHEGQRAELAASLDAAEGARARAQLAADGASRQCVELRALLEVERERHRAAAHEADAQARRRGLEARAEIEGLDKVVAELRAQLELKSRGTPSAAEAARAAAAARRLAAEEGALIGSLREALAAAGRRRDEADAEAAAALRRQRRVEAELDAERSAARSSVAAAEREADRLRRQAADAELARGAEAAKLEALQQSLADPDGPTQRKLDTLQAALRQQELQLQKAFGARDSAEAEVRELRALASSQVELSEQLASEARREQKRAREAAEALASDNDQLRVLLGRPRSAAHRDELLQLHASEVQRLRAQLQQLEAREKGLHSRVRDAERRADLGSIDSVAAVAMIHRAQALVA